MSDNPQADNTDQQNRAIEQQAMNPTVTDENGEVVAGEPDKDPVKQGEEPQAAEDNTEDEE